MATAVVGGPTTWSMTRERERGHRDYKVTYLVEGNRTDGPATALQTPGLPVFGSPYQIDGDLDIWAFCTREASVKPRVTGEPNTLFDIEFTFSTKPFTACQDLQWEDPLLEPQKISGSFVNYKEEVSRDRFGFPILNSAFELMRGHQVEFDANRPQVKIEQNCIQLQIRLLARMVDCVNKFRLWGLPPRTVKLSQITWERTFYGRCYVYFKRTLEFDIRYDTFDRDILDEGTKVLNGHWHPTEDRWVLDNIGGAPPDPTNPSHFRFYVDRKGNPGRVILNGHGQPASRLTSPQDTYISIGSGSVGHPLTDTGFWLPVYGPFDPVEEWVPDFEYIVGNITKDLSGTVFVLTADLGGLSTRPGAGGSWLELGNEDSVPNDRGTYDNGTTYELGDIVLEPAAAALGAGNIHIEKYPGADFLWLGIPIDLDFS